MIAKVVVIVRGSGEQPGDPETTGRNVVVQVNGHLLPCKSITLRCDGPKAVATLEIDVDEVVIQDMRARFNAIDCGVEHNADGTIAISHRDEHKP